MKPVENKSGATSAKKKAQISIKQSLIAALKKVAGNFGTGSDKLEQEIEKGSKKLAKKIVKEIKLNDAPTAKDNKNSKITKASETPAAPTVIKSEPIPAKPKAVAPKKKETKPAVVAKPVAVKPAAVKKEKTAAKK